MIPLAMPISNIVPDAPQGTITTAVFSPHSTLLENNTRLLFTNGVQGWAKAKVIPVVHNFLTA